MMVKKGITPSHVKARSFSHPEINHPIIEILFEIEDPRKPSLFFKYPLISVLFMTVVAMMCGADDWPQVITMSEGMADWLANYVDMSSGVPCERTFKNIFGAIRPEGLEKALQELSTLFRARIPQEVINFDGQTQKGTADKHKDLTGIHLLHAWSVDNGLCLGQLKVDDKSNEITAMPRLMEILDLRRTIITADAMNTQKTIVAKAVEKQADYVLPVKGNQPTLLQEIILAFEGFEKEQSAARIGWEHSVNKAREHRDADRLQKLLQEGAPVPKSSYWQDEPEKGHGRIETRNCTAIPAKGLPVANDWPGLTSLVRVNRERIKGESASGETVYYISSLIPDAVLISEVIRQHWSVENKLHWRLDVIFRQDDSRYRDRIGARNLAAIRKMVLNTLLKAKSVKGSVATKRCRAACDPGFRTKLLEILL